MLSWIKFSELVVAVDVTNKKCLRAIACRATLVLISTFLFLFLFSQTHEMSHSKRRAAVSRHRALLFSK